MGTPVANRNRAETEDLIGFFVNTLVLRADLGGRSGLRASCSAAVARDGPRGLRPPGPAVREAGRGAGAGPRPVAHAPLPGAARRRPARRRRPRWSCRAVARAACPSQTGTAKFDLFAGALEELDGELAADLEYDADLFDPATVAGSSASFAALLAGAVAGSRHRLGSCPLLERGRAAQVTRGARYPRARREAPGRSSSVAPRTPLEEQLAGLWAEVLGVERLRTATTTSSSWAATRCWRPAWSPACARSFGVELPLRAALRGADPRRLRGGDRGGRWRGSRPRTLPPIAPRAAGRARCRSPSPSSGSGSSTVWSRAARSTTSPSPAPRGAPGRRRARRGARRDRAPPRGAAHHLRVDAASGEPVQVVAGRRALGAPAGRPRGPARGEPARRRRSACSRAEAAPPIRPRPRAPPARRCWCGWARSDHRLALTLHHIVSDGWSIGVLRARAPGPLRRRRGGLPFAAAGAAPAVRGLLGAGSGAGSRAASWSRSSPGGARPWPAPRRPRPAHRPAAARRARACAGAPERCPSARSCSAAVERARPAPGRDAVHDPAGRLPGAPLPLHRPGRPVGGHPDRQPHRTETRGPDRVLRQHPGPAHRPRRAIPPSPSSSAACARRRSPPTPTRTCRSRSWSRSWRRSATCRAARCSRSCSPTATRAPRRSSWRRA